MERLGWICSVALMSVLLMGAYDPSGYVNQNASASLYEYNDSGSDINVVTAGTYYKWTTSATGTSSTYAVADATDDDITIQTGGAGKYLINISCTFDGTNAAVFEAAAFVDGNEIEAACFQRTLGTPSKLGAGSTTCTTYLADGAVLDLRVTSDSNGDDFSVHRMSFDVVRVGGPE